MSTAPRVLVTVLATLLMVAGGGVPAVACARSFPPDEVVDFTAEVVWLEHPDRAEGAVLRVDRVFRGEVWSREVVGEPDRCLEGPLEADLALGEVQRIVGRRGSDGFVEGAMVADGDPAADGRSDEPRRDAGPTEFILVRAVSRLREPVPLVAVLLVAVAALRYRRYRRRWALGPGTYVR